jgi:hypothetical protein
VISQTKKKTAHRRQSTDVEIEDKEEEEEEEEAKKKTQKLVREREKRETYFVKPRKAKVDGEERKSLLELRS